MHKGNAQELYEELTSLFDTIPYETLNDYIISRDLYTINLMEQFAITARDAYRVIYMPSLRYPLEIIHF